MINADSFVQQIRANVNNLRLSDEAFREFIRNTLPIVKAQEYECAYCGANLGTNPNAKCSCPY